MTINTPYANQLLINRPKPSDGGTYTCKATVEGETQELQATISFVGESFSSHKDICSAIKKACMLKKARGCEQSVALVLDLKPA